jgi:hypothetical protein
MHVERVRSGLWFRIAAPGGVPERERAKPGWHVLLLLPVF